jgi:glycosyl transferase/beta-hydroxylase protein BlmF
MMAHTPQTLSLLLPTRGRPAEFARFVKSVAETAAAPGRVEILAYVDEDDPRKFDYVAGFKALAAEPAVAGLMNIDLRVDEPLTTPMINNILAERAQGSVLMIANDDQVFRDPGWDARIDDGAARFPDGIFCLWFNDGRYGEKLCTFPILGRRWVEVLGYVEPPFFEHFNCDLWTWQIALMIGRTHYIGDILVEHLHPDTGKSQADETTARNLKGNRAERDRAMFVKFERYRILDAERLRDAINAARS